MLGWEGVGELVSRRGVEKVKMRGDERGRVDREKEREIK